MSALGFGFPLFEVTQIAFRKKIEVSLIILAPIEEVKTRQDKLLLMKTAF